MMPAKELLGRVGVWSRELRFQPDRASALEAAAELEELGYGALWVPDAGGDVLGVVEQLLLNTQHITIATGILNIWMHSAQVVAAGVEELPGAARFLCGLGASHPSVVNADHPGRYGRPLSVMRSYLEELDAADPPLPAERRMLAALGPKMLTLSAARSAGAHPYLVSPSHTRLAREIVGPEACLAPEQGVVLSDDPEAGFEVARAHVSDYLKLPNYVASFRRMGFDDQDWDDGPSRRLVDELIAYGDESAIAARVAEHLEAGADHVCIQVVGQHEEALALAQWRRLAPALVGL